MKPKITVYLPLGPKEWRKQIRTKFPQFDLEIVTEPCFCPGSFRVTVHRDFTGTDARELEKYIGSLFEEHTYSI